MRVEKTCPLTSFAASLARKTASGALCSAETCLRCSTRFAAAGSFGGMDAVIRVQAPAGTNVLLPVAGRTALASTGLFRERGQWGNLPTGEAYLAPLEGRSSGVVVVDGSMAGIGVTTQPIRIVVENGYATEITGGREADELIALLEPHGRDARNVAEFGIGTNDRAKLSGVILEDEKVMGTIHIAFGDNKSMGGRVGVASHLDGLVTQPTVWFDERKIMDAGRLLAVD